MILKGVTECEQQHIPSMKLDHVDLPVLTHPLLSTSTNLPNGMLASNLTSSMPR